MLPGLGGRGNGSSYLMGTEYLYLSGLMKVLEVGGGDGCTAL